MARYLVVAHQTAESPQLVDAVAELAKAEPAHEFVLLVPATPVEHLATWTEGEAHAIAAARADAARARMEGAGAKVIDTLIGDHRPYEAVMDALNDAEYDAVLVSTFKPGLSRWLGMDLINRLQRNVDLPITHVVAM